MVKLRNKEKTNFERDLYEAQVEEALAKWEIAKPLETSQKKTEIPQPKKSQQKENDIVKKKGTRPNKGKDSNQSAHNNLS